MNDSGTLPTIAKACLALVLSTTLPALAGDRSVAEFKESENLDWQVVNDGVMGGLSRGKIEVSEKDILKFSGTLSLENNGGFSSIRTGDVQLNLANSEGLQIRVKGDGRTYEMRLNTEAQFRGMEVSFMAEFPTKAGEWSEVKVPFDNFTGSFRGMKLKDAKFDPSNIRRVGLILADKKPGPFELQVDWIRTYPADSKTIVDTALADGRFKTLATALTKAGLVDALKSEGPFTVFAPTDDAFAKLPKGTVENLLKKENQEQLQAILKYHVTSGATKLSAALQAGEATTLQGDVLNIGFNDGRVRVGQAAILVADIECDNGVIHIIDAVLLPKADDKKPKRPDAPSEVTATDRIEDAITRGVPVFNKGDHAACAKIYKNCLAELAADERIDTTIREAMKRVLEHTIDQKSATEQAWTYRKSLDHVHTLLTDS